MYAFSLQTSREETLSHPASPQLFQVFFEEIGTGGICSNPVPVQQEIVDLIRENKLLDIDFLFAQRLSQLQSLLRWGRRTAA